MKKITVIVVAALTLSFQLLTLNLVAQDIHFSQFTMVPLQLDPSQAGKFRGDIRAIMNYRNQWSSVASNPYRTYGASFDMPFGNKKKDNFFGGGLNIYSDKAGALNLGITVVNLTVAYHIRVSQSGYLSAGLQGGFLQSSLNIDNIRSDNQFDGTGYNDNLPSGENFANNSFFEPDFAAGVSYTYGDNTTNQVISNNGFNGKKVMVGAAIHHVVSPNYSFLEKTTDNLNFRRYVLHTNTSFGIGGTNIAVQPSGFVAYQQKAVEVVLGSYFRYNLKENSKYTQFSHGVAMSFGIHYRFGDAFFPSILVEMGSIAFGVSYDFNLSGLKPASNGQGGYELSIRYINPNPFKKSQARFF